MSFDQGSLLAIDAGNTRTKWALFDATREISSQGACLNADLASAEFLPKDSLCKTVIIANVAGAAIAHKLTEKCQALGLAITWAKASDIACGVTNHYDNPTQLGVDRWAALIAAWDIYKTPCLVVSLGTAVTIDALTATPNSAEFFGGVIVPGLKLLQQTLVSGTSDIANGVASKTGKFENFPTNTADAVQTGAYLALIGAIAEMAEKLQAHIGNQQAVIILSGGDANILMPLLATKFNTDSIKRVFVHDNLVLQGLYLLEREQE